MRSQLPPNKLLAQMKGSVSMCLFLPKQGHGPWTDTIYSSSVLTAKIAVWGASPNADTVIIIIIMAVNLCCWPKNLMFSAGMFENTAG